MMDTVAESVPFGEWRPYDVYQLQSEFPTSSPQEAYTQLCLRFKCRPNSTLAAMLPTTVGAWGKVESIDLSRTYVGPRGVVPVVELCKRLPRLRCLNLAGGYLQNESLWFVAQLAMYHPCLAEVDVSHNEFISWSGAMCLATVAAQNQRLTCVHLLKTSVEPATAEAIFYQTRRNAMAVALGKGRAVRQSTGSPAAVHLRAMRRFFDQIKDPATGGTDRAGLISGYTERLHTMGDGGVEHRRDGFLEELAARAPSDHVTWEVFLVLVLLDAVEYSEVLVAALRRVFCDFNLCAAVATHSTDTSARTSTAGPSTTDTMLSDGLVEVADFPAMYTRLVGEHPSQGEMAALRASLGLDGADCTVNWDEFLFAWYSRGPVKGSRLLGMNATQLPRRIRPIHS